MSYLEWRRRSRCTIQLHSDLCIRLLHVNEVMCREPRICFHQSLYCIVLTTNTVASRTSQWYSCSFQFFLDGDSFSSTSPCNVATADSGSLTTYIHVLSGVFERVHLGRASFLVIIAVTMGYDGGCCWVNGMKPSEPVLKL